ncbi:hypothetical protein PHLGIDRAFT_116845 [Phlebiopsis gigantea 11061_1 CR5-6]|uniref:Uncharacterized protein n=1 Tax=Phlebiopsis gigantea (strain 11061_1 CR5-6) TaxID=745531 RepID=A0A0C3NUI3_PHLG1|nr:hypothetical protein PHLGIDRAFT_116845 [Phlebiopsis gigantea 11061_1 CR5-6]
MAFTFDPAVDEYVKLTDSTRVRPRRAPLFKAILDAVLDGSILQHHHGIGRVSIRYSGEASGTADVDMRHIMAMQAEYVVDGRRVLLKGSQRFDLSRLEGEDEELDYLVAVAVPSDVGSATQGEKN